MKPHFRSFGALKWLGEFEAVLKVANALVLSHCAQSKCIIGQSVIVLDSSLTDSKDDF